MREDGNSSASEQDARSGGDESDRDAGKLRPPPRSPSLASRLALLIKTAAKEDPALMSHSGKREILI